LRKSAGAREGDEISGARCQQNHELKFDLKIFNVHEVEVKLKKRLQNIKSFWMSFARSVSVQNILFFAQIR
jgi:hypothetical protein